jgi:probable HAF family extracellular repeat protein
MNTLHSRRRTLRLDEGAQGPPAARTTNRGGFMLESLRFAGMQGLTPSALLALVAALLLPLQLFAQPPAMHHHYKLIDIGTFGGPQSYPPVTGTELLAAGLELNNSGVLVGFADTTIPDPIIPLDPPGMSLCFVADCDVAYAFQWQDGVMSDLGSLRRGWSSAPMAISANGLIAGYSENGKIDPLLSIPQLETAEVRAVLWQNGRIKNLGTLPEGGYESAALAVNSGGQVVGAAMNTIPDASPLAIYSVYPIAAQTTQTRAFLWDGAVMRDLGTMGGTDAAALAINERGQVMGLSYSSATQPSACNPTAAVPLGTFIWDQTNGMRNIGTLGGTCTMGLALNNRGQVAGISWLENDACCGHAFLWEDGVIQDLGPLDAPCTGVFALSESGQAVGVWCLSTGYHAALWTKVGQSWQITDLGTTDNDPCSNAFDINAQGQIVGGSQSLAECQGEGDSTTAFLWENGSIVDLNALIPPGSALYLVEGNVINDQGEIAGYGVDANGNSHAFLLIPCDSNHPDKEGCDYSQVDAATAAVLYRPSFAVDPAVVSQAERSPANKKARLRSLIMKRTH